MDRFQVLHIEPRKEVASGLMRHIDRVQFVNGIAEVWVPANADITKTEGNVELISRHFVKEDGKKTMMTIQQAIDRRIHEAGIQHVKPNQNKCIEVLLSGSPDIMQNMSREQLLNWGKDCVDWARNKFGEKNVVSADLHVDETTPHIHMFVVPIVSGKPVRTAKRHKSNKEKNEAHRKYNVDDNRLRLCCNEVYTTGRLYRYHDTLAEEVSNRHGMIRGIKADPGHKKRHKDSIEFNRELERQKRMIERQLAELTSDYDDIDAKTAEAVEALQNLQKDIQSKSRDTDYAQVLYDKNKLKQHLQEHNGFTRRMMYGFLKTLNPNQEELTAIKEITTGGNKKLEQWFDEILHDIHEAKARAMNRQPTKKAVSRREQKEKKTRGVTM